MRVRQRLAGHTSAQYPLHPARSTPATFPAQAGSMGMPRWERSPCVPKMIYTKDASTTSKELISILSLAALQRLHQSQQHTSHARRALQRTCCRVASSDFRTREKKDVRVLVVGSTGYIGKFVVKELISRGFNVVAFAREQSGVGGRAKREDTEKVLPVPHRNTTPSKSSVTSCDRDGSQRRSGLVAGCLACNVRALTHTPCAGKRSTCACRSLPVRRYVSGTCKMLSRCERSALPSRWMSWSPAWPAGQAAR